jgi:putative phage-type endonuclease
MFKSACKYLSSLERLNPLATHPSYLEEWKELQIEMCNFGTEEEKIVDAILQFREDTYTACLESQVCDSPEITDWQWLLTVEQMPQRTEEWYLQKSRLLTASEIAAIWRGVKSRNALIHAKVSPQLGSSNKRLACLKAETSPMDWGVRYEPVVKLLLEKKLSCKIQELGRIYHQTIPGLAASPDGLITEGPVEYVGSLVEIKCPSSRVINDDIPFEYWCQMQIQMEVCNIPRCEYVEAKFKEGDAVGDDSGWITLDIHKESDDMRYQYHTGTPTEAPEWLSIETYPWTLIQFRRKTVYRDTEWFRVSKDDITSFWKDVEAVKAGTLTIEPPKKRKVIEKEVVSMFQAEDSQS